MQKQQTGQLQAYEVTRHVWRYIRVYAANVHDAAIVAENSDDAAWEESPDYDESTEAIQ